MTLLWASSVLGWEQLLAGCGLMIQNMYVSDICFAWSFLVMSVSQSISEPKQDNADQAGWKIALREVRFLSVYRTNQWPNAFNTKLIHADSSKMTRGFSLGAGSVQQTALNLLKFQCDTCVSALITPSYTDKLKTHSVLISYQLGFSFSTL